MKTIMTLTASAFALSATLALAGDGSKGDEVKELQAAQNQTSECAAASDDASATLKTATRERKESGEKGGTEDINIGVGELQECTISEMEETEKPNTEAVRKK